MYSSGTDATIRMRVEPKRSRNASGVRIFRADNCPTVKDLPLRRILNSVCCTSDVMPVLGGS